MIRAVSTVLAIAALFGAVAAAQQGALPTVLTQAVAATQAAKAAYAFDFDLDTSKQNWRARFDPNATPRLRLVQPAREELKGDERRAFDRIAEDMEGVSWCASDNMARVAGVRLVREDETTATYAFQPTPESIRGEQARRFAERLRGEFTVTKQNPDITHVRLYAPEPFTAMAIARIERVNIAITCQAAPNGRRYAAETVTEIRGSALGQAFDERSVQRARNLR